MNLRRVLQTAGPLLGLVATWLFFALLAGPSFTRLANQELMLLQTAVVGTAAVGATWIIVAGGIDLSVGSTLALGTMVGAYVLRAGGSPWLAALATVATGALVGALIGALVVGRLVQVVSVVGAVVLAGALSSALPLAARVGLAALAGGLVALAVGRLRVSLPLSPFIVTLGLWGALRGLAKGLGDNQPIYPPSMGSLGNLMLAGRGGLPLGVWVLLVVALVAGLALKYTVFGQHVVALGSNRETARLCGIDVPRREVQVYVLGILCAGVAAVLQLSYLSMGDPTTAQGYELKTIAAAVIGGASLAGGEGSILGTLVGALIMTVVDNGCTKLGLDNWVQELVTGGIIVAAVALDRWRAKPE